MRKPTPSAPGSAERLEEIDAAIAELRRRQAAQPSGDAGFVRRCRLALLISAFERRRDLIELQLSANDASAASEP